MTKAAFERIAAGLNEAISIARGEAEPARLHNPQELDVKAVRKRTRYSQEKFAQVFGFTLKQIRAWELARTRPLGGVRAYLMLIARDHARVARMLGETWEQRAALYEVLAMRDNHQVHLQRSFCANHSFTPTVDSGTVIAGIHDNNGEGDGRK